MKRISYYCSLLMLAGVAALSSCDDTKTYAEKLEDEKDAIRAFVRAEGIQAVDVSENQLKNYITYAADWRDLDNHFKENTWYKFEDGLYMNIRDFGDTTDMYVNMNYPDIVLRVDSAYNLLTFTSFDASPGSNNLDGSGWLIQSWKPGYTTTYGTGVAFPIRFLGTKAEVSLIVPSKLGNSYDQTDVIPYFYKSIRYKPSFQ